MVRRTMTSAKQGKRERQVELDEVLRNAQQAQPGVFDLVQVYKGCGGPMKVFEQYLAATRRQSVTTTSNQSQPTPRA